jgi:putative copper resistance protein D
MVVDVASIPMVLEATAKAITYAAVLIAIGTSVVRWLMLRQLDRSTHLSDVLHHRVLTIAATAALLLVASLALRAWTHMVSVFGLSEASSWRNLQLIVVQSRWGSGWRVQGAAALGLVAATRWARRDRRAGWLAITAASIGVSYSLPLIGHAAGSDWRILLHGSHLLGASAWLGTLAVLLIVRLWNSEKDQTPGREAVMGSWLRGFAPAALVGATTLTLTGAIAAWLYLGSMSSLWSTWYGRLLSLKLALFAGVAGCGYANWRWLHARSTGGPDADVAANARHTAPLVGLEVVLAAVVIVITAVLTELEHP